MDYDLKNIDNFIKSSLIKILNKSGEIYTEQKFCSIFSTFEKLSQTSAFEGKLDIDSRKEYYEYFFPNLAPKSKNVEIVFDNIMNKEAIFKFKFHPSEAIYSVWIDNYLSNKPSKEKCEKLIEEYNNWVNTRISIITTTEIKNWLESIGIELSMTTCQFLLEYGLPYCGYLIKPQNLFHFSGKTKSIIGLLAFNLERIKEGSNQNPLKDPVILALSRLEYFLCSNIAI